jgi:anti-anti-sigma factor
MVYEEVFDCRLRTDGAPVQVVLRGELDADCAERVDRILAEAVEQTSGDIVVDVSELTFLSACGLGSLAVVADQLAARGGVVRLRGAAPLVLRVLTVTELDQQIVLEPSTAL